jgi:phage-related tail fiber protein
MGKTVFSDGVPPVKGTRVTAAFLNWLQDQLVPVGSVFHFAMSAAPVGFLECNGGSVSRTTYAGLFAAIGTTFGTGDGSTTFTLPDLRDDFIRGSSGTTRPVGARESSTIESHKHLVPFGENRGVGGFPFGQTSGSKPGSGSSDSDNYWMFTNDGTDYSGEVINRSGLIGNETRPRNVALLVCIKC